jgi:hypothetical protein
MVAITLPAGFVPEPPKQVFKFELKGRSRNLPCPCGSGKHWKRCHPYLPPGFVPPILKRTDGPEVLEKYIDDWLTRHNLVK